MLIHLLSRSGPPIRDEIEGFLGTPRDARTSADIQRIKQMMDDHGSIAFARSTAVELATAALAEFPAAFGHLPDSPDKGFLEALPTYMIERSY